MNDIEYEVLLEESEVSFSDYLKGIEKAFAPLPRVSIVNLISGLLLTNLTDYVVEISNNGYGMEAAGLKKIMLSLIKELDKTGVPTEEIGFVKKIESGQP